MNSCSIGGAVWLAPTLHLGTGSTAKLEALTAAMFVLFFVQAIATYYRNYWASMAGHRLIFDLRYALYMHMQRLSHSFFDRNDVGRGGLALHLGYLDGAELRRLRDDQHLDGRRVAGLRALAAVLLRTCGWRGSR